VNDSTRKPTVFLSLVKDQSERARFVSLESLDPDRRELVQKYHRLMSPQSVLVGAIVASSKYLLDPSQFWDIRPVFLHRGVMMVGRMFSAELCKSSSLRDEFKSFIFQVERLFPNSQALVCGSAEGYSWVTRRYFNTLLSDTNIDIPLATRPKLIRQLLLDIQKLHANGFVHGHIQPHNIAYENGSFVLLDYGIQIKDPGVSSVGTLAPELRESVASKLNASPASDLYGVGLVAKRLFGGELMVGYSNLIEVLLLDDPKLRPSLDQVIGHFAAEPEPEQSVNDLTAVVNEVKMNSGKLNKQKLDHSVVDKKSKDSNSKEAFSNLFKKASDVASPKIIFSVGILILLSFAGIFIFQKSHSTEVSVNADKVSDYKKLWSSGQIPLMQEVVKKALDNDMDALMVLKESLQTGSFRHPSIQQRIFTVGFHPFWADEITDQDFKALLIYGAPSFAPPGKRTAPELQTLHPAVALAIAASISVVPNFEPFAAVTTDKLGTLPSIYGTSFLALKGIGVENLSNVASQCLAHILTADFSTSILTEFLSLSDQPAVSLIRLSILEPLFSQIKGLAEQTYQAVSVAKDHPLSWFASDVVAGWQSVSAEDKLGCFMNQYPQNLSFEQQVDLLRFPLAPVRQEAKAKLLSQVGQPFSNLIDYLSSAEVSLTRTQAISLIATFLVPSEKSKQFALQWFDTNPEPESIKKLLVLRPPTTSTDDPFNIAAARYLLTKEVAISFDEAQILVKHQEALVRALAYSKLPLVTDQDKNKFKELLKEEKDQALRRRQEERLKE
jgi:serine/threonine protein kinase